MHSAFISSRLRYRAVPLAGQLVHKRSVHPGPLVLGTTPFNSPAPTPDRDRTVSRRSEPSSRTALIGEQPNPWDLLQPQDAMSRHRMCLHVYPRHRLFLLFASQPKSCLTLPRKKVRALGYYLSNHPEGENRSLFFRISRYGVNIVPQCD